MTFQIINPDELWFKQHERRKTHIRKVIDDDEFKGEFASLGPHDHNRRYVLLLRIPETNKILPIPFLAFADEDIRDEDSTLLPIIDGIMKDEAARQGIKTR